MTERLAKRIPSSEAPWFSRFQHHLAARQYTGALRLLERVIEDDLPLFDVDEEISAERRVAWLCRIDLLREMGKFTEALAWACLECELHPDNAAAQAVKDELKRLTRFGRRPGESPTLDRTPPVVRWQGLAGMRRLRARRSESTVANRVADFAGYRFRFGLTLDWSAEFTFETQSVVDPLPLEVEVPQNRSVGNVFMFFVKRPSFAARFLQKHWAWDETFRMVTRRHDFVTQYSRAALID